jgi:CheY-like chemotaxis protein/HPt (histidine-containing phosphotransfer) domain-containing protein
VIEPATARGRFALAPAGVRVESVESLREVGRALRAAMTQRTRFDVIAIDATLIGADVAAFAAAVSGYGAPILVLDWRDQLALRLAALRHGLFALALGDRSVSALRLVHGVGVASGRLAAHRRAQRTAGPDLPAYHAVAKDLPVLVIDDTPMNVVIAQRQLAQMGLIPDTAADGREGLEKAMARPYAIILVDVSMPEMDGFEFTRRYRAFEAGRADWPRVPVVAVTGNALDGDEQACLDAGMDAYTTKPVQIERLAQMLMRFLPPPDAVAAAPPSRPLAAAPSAAARAAQEPEVPAIDIDQFIKTIGMADPVMIRQLLEFFVESFVDILDRLGAAIVQRDRAAVEAAAHAGKGSARSAAAVALGDILADLEHEAQTASFDYLSQQAGAAHSGYMAVRRYVATLSARSAA